MRADGLSGPAASGPVTGVWSSNAQRLAGAPMLVDRALLEERGVDVDVARRSVAAGRWHDVVPGSWWRGPGLPRHVLCETAVGAAGPRALLTGADACAGYGMRDVPQDPLVTVLLPHDVRRRLGARVRTVRTHHLPASFVVAGVPTVEPAAAVEAAARVCRSLQDVRALVTAAVADAWCSPVELREQLARGPSAGSALLRRATADVELGARSAPEAEVAQVLARLVRRGRLPPFLLNVQLWCSGVLLGRVDGYLPGTCVGWEVDSLRHHGSSADLDRTLQRSAAFSAAGIHLEHVTPARFRSDPGAWALQLVRRVAAGAAPPPGLVLGRPDAVAPPRPRTTPGLARPGTA